MESLKECLFDYNVEIRLLALQSIALLSASEGAGRFQQNIRETGYDLPHSKK